ncbi:MAG TPA: hypothetical protein PLI27_00600 [Ignavibacteriales bacterium]|nr:hypothetical protein [Ignavibacteriales bacterium]HOL81168.1 hypothetical protein [Ignavibacteriales bacterium]HOM65271.1 hypothetical protein [Ignavibacteriales bacterium]HPD66563.1 hypothetical protein [Ignavibacteriales bacterium]HPP33476.1 hypothetical protein [Ignavibacteriales bacterium]
MKRNSIFSNILLFIYIISLSFWSIATILKAFVVFNFFQPLNNLPLKSAFLNTNDSQIVFFIKHLTEFIEPLIFLSVYAFFIALFFFILYIIIFRINIKNNGWVFISLIILVFMTGFKLYLSQFDFKILNFQNYGITDIINYYRLIVNKIPNFIFGEFLIGMVLLYMAIFKPLVKKTDTNGSL